MYLSKRFTNKYCSNMKTYFNVIFMLLFQTCLWGQVNFNNFKSSKYGYTIEYPTDFSFKEATGRNVDFKVVNPNGSSIITVVRELPYEERNLTASDLLLIPNEQWEQSLPLPNVTVLKKGKCTTNQGKGMFIHYTSKNMGTDAYTLYYMNYMFIHNGYIYTVTTACDVNDLALMQAKFFRALESFSLN